MSDGIMSEAVVTKPVIISELDPVEWPPKKVEYLHVTDRLGSHVRTAIRKTLEADGRAYWETHGEAPFAMPVVYIFLVNSRQELLLAKRSKSKPDNPGLWDKSCGGHVKAFVPPQRETILTNAAAAVRGEMWEELGITAFPTHDLLEYRTWERTLDGNRSDFAILRLIDFLPWFPSHRIDADGRQYVRRHAAAVYAGVYDGSFKYRDGEVEKSEWVPLGQVLARVEARGSNCIADLPVLLRRYLPLMSSDV